MNKRKNTLCVFCGSSYGANPVHREEARRLGSLIGTEGFNLVFGGGDVGLMGETARAARDAGAAVTSVLPQFLRHMEPPLQSGSELVTTMDLQERKGRMTALSDAFVVLPGGLGTLDEFFEVVTMSQLDVHRKPVILINTGGFFEPLLALIKATIDAGFARPEAVQLFHVAANAYDAINAAARLLGGTEK
jgi:uncharacterized protein (TIGR00730 family)